jgi:hypothetical protein
MSVGRGGTVVDCKKGGSLFSIQRKVTEEIPKCSLNTTNSKYYPILESPLKKIPYIPHHTSIPPHVTPTKAKSKNFSQQHRNHSENPEFILTLLKQSKGWIARETLVSEAVPEGNGCCLLSVVCC